MVVGAPESGGITITTVGGSPLPTSGGQTWTGGTSEDPNVAEQAQNANEQAAQATYQNINDVLHGGLVDGGDTTSGVDYGGGDNDSPSGSDDSSTGSPNQSPNGDRPTSDPYPGVEANNDYGTIDLGESGPGGGESFELPQTGGANDGQMGVIDLPDSIGGGGAPVQNAEQAQQVSGVISDVMQRVEALNGQNQNNTNQNSPSNDAGQQGTQTPAWLRNAFMSGPWSGGASNDGGMNLNGTTIAVGALALLALGIGVFAL